jgi:hypothetical protein
MRETDDPNRPPPSILGALRRPRRTQLHDQCVKALLAQWKRLGRPIEYDDLGKVADAIGVKNPKAETRRKIVAAVEAAGIEIHNYDGFRQRIAESGMMPSLNGIGSTGLIQEAKWRWPEKWDSEQADVVANRVLVRRGRMQYVLEPEGLKSGDEVLPWPDDEEVWL